MTDQEFIDVTRGHQRTVRVFIGKIISRLLERSIEHDNSKFKEPEYAIFKEYTPKLASTTYGSDAYKEGLRKMEEARRHHYKENPHHPEHFTNGIKDMSLVDLCEMFCDWKAASLRHNNGNIIVSIEKNQKRFGYSDELKQIFLNTLPVIEANFDIQQEPRP